ncbi:DUF6452 family protein [Namhaeicola litoreus]|uniref:DUF6452 family protein n=1 Tax=Namhaeicola litoreus TaxID=1052145 RepID=A0ABW3Y1X4_9FLAO
MIPISKSFFDKRILLLALACLFFSCENDDICVEPNTPRLIIRFYDIDNPESKKAVPFLGIKVDGQEDFYVDSGISQSPDSVVVPLEVVKDLTTIKLIKFGTDALEENDEEDEIELSYGRDEEFVSQSCGFRIIYTNVKSSNSANNTWVKQVEPISDSLNIIDESKHHIKIYH